MHQNPNHLPSAGRAKWYAFMSQVLRGLQPSFSTVRDRRFAAAFVIGYGSGPVCTSREVGASVVTAPAPAGRPPAPPHYSRNAYGPQDLRPVEWYAQPWYSSPREVLP